MTKDYFVRKITEICSEKVNRNDSRSYVCFNEGEPLRESSVGFKHTQRSIWDYFNKKGHVKLNNKYIIKHAVLAFSKWF